MKKIIFAQVMADNGKSVFSGLFDENGDPVSVETECDDSGVTLTIWRNAPERERRDCVSQRKRLRGLALCMMTAVIVRCGIIAMKMRRLYHELSL